MVQAIGLLKDGKADAVVSCGNTGALMAGGTLRLRPLPGVDRPALDIIVPSKKKPFVLIDVGANPESNAINLAHNAVLGSNYAKAALNIENPRVGLLTIGTEEGKGNSLINATHTHLQTMNGVINYAGPIEGFNLDGDFDAVGDGFVGNIVLKSNPYSRSSATLKKNWCVTRSTWSEPPLQIRLRDMRTRLARSARGRAIAQHARQHSRSHGSPTTSLSPMLSASPRTRHTI